MKHFLLGFCKLTSVAFGPAMQTQAGLPKGGRGGMSDFLLTQAKAVDLQELEVAHRHLRQRRF